jgi:LysM repeat protein
MIKKVPALLILALSLVVSVHAQPFSRAEYIRKFQLLAISEMSRSGIPASVKMAQACLESADGNSTLARKSNNHFGIKCKGGWMGGKSYHDDDEKGECFRKYDRVEESYIDHTNFLMSQDRYNSLFQLSSTDYVAWAKGLKRAGYATDPAYDRKVIDIIEEYKLWQLDRKITFEEMAELDRERMGAAFNKSLLINPYSSRKITLHNGIRMALMREGDTFEILAQEFGLAEWELRRFNDFPEGYHPVPGEIIYLKQKKGKAQGMYKLHVVKEGESMHYISQVYGIRLTALYRLNRIPFGEPVKVGQVLKLQRRGKV